MLLANRQSMHSHSLHNTRVTAPTRKRLWRCKWQKGATPESAKTGRAVYLCPHPPLVRPTLTAIFFTFLCMVLRPFSAGLTGLCIPDGVDTSSRGSPRIFKIPLIDFILRSSSRIFSCFPRLHVAASPRLWRVLPLRQHFLLAVTTFGPLSTCFFHALRI